MYEAHYRAFGGKLVVKVSGEDVKGLFSSIGEVAEILDGDTACGKCGSQNIYPRCRVAKGYDYYELVCSDCEAKLNFGQRKDGGLFAKRKLDDGSLMDHRGWHIYRAIEAPKGAQPGTRRTAPEPSPADSVEIPKVELEMMLNARDYDAWNKTAGEFYHKHIRGLLSKFDAEEVWNNVTERHGAPEDNFKCADAVSRALYSEALRIKREKGK